MSEDNVIPIRVDAEPASSRHSQWLYVARLVLEQLGVKAAVAPGASDNRPPEGKGVWLGDRVLLPAAKLDELFGIATLKREIDSGLRDRHGRFDEDHSPWPGDRPVIWDFATELRRQLQDAHLPAPSPPSTFRVFFTHDVDRTTDMEPVMLFKWFLRTLKLVPPDSQLKHPFAPHRITSLVERLLEIEAAMGISSWTFCLAGPYSIREGGSRYDSNWPSARRIFRAIRNHHGHIGLHGSFYAHEQDAYERERRRLENACGTPVVSHRNHYLRFDSSRLWTQLEQAGIQLDMSIGYVRRIGFRSGLCHAYRPYDLLRQKPANVIEVPMIFMENYDYLELDPTLAYVASQLQIVKQAGGCVSILLHPDKMAADDGSWIQFYRCLIRVARDMGADVSGQLPKFDADQLVWVG